MGSKHLTKSYRLVPPGLCCSHLSQLWQRRKTISWRKQSWGYEGEKVATLKPSYQEAEKPVPIASVLSTVTPKGFGM